VAPNGERVARRVGQGLLPALRSLVARHDVTGIASAMTEEDRVVATESEHEPVAETARDGSAYRLRLIAHDDQAYDWFYNVVANPMLWFLQHYMWGLTESTDIDLWLHNALFGGYLPLDEYIATALVA